MNILSSTSTLINNVLTARAERIAQDPGTEEVVDPRQPQPSKPVDTVELSKQYEDMKKLEELQKTAPRINWENRTYDGKPIPDIYHQELTPEMISGEQAYSVITSWTTGEIVYMEEKLPQNERVVAQSYEFIQNSQQQIERATALVKTYNDVSATGGKVPDPKAQMLFDINAKSMETSFQRFLENMVLGYDKLGIDLNDARDQMLKLSNGTFDLGELLSKYFS
jgi:hypothetical protein